MSLVIGCLRRLGLVLFMLAVAPGVTELFEELACAVAGVECCEGDCCEAGGWDACPKSCLHCACCPHATALPSAAALGPEPASPRRRLPLGAVLGVGAAGYRAPPFRPPLA